MLVATVAIVVVACGGAPTSARRETAPPAPRSPSWLAPPECRIEAARAERLIVSRERGDPFTVALSNGVLALTPTADGRRLTAEVEHPLRFRATAPLDDQRMVLARAAELTAGAVQAVAGASVASLATNDRGLVAQLALGRSLSGPGIELLVGPVSLDCAQLAVSHEPSTASVLPRHVTGGELRIASALPLIVRPVRPAPLSVEVRPREQGGFVPVWIIDRQGDDARVAIVFSDGARVSGWVELSSLREPSAEEAERIERIVGMEPERLDLNLAGATPEPDTPMAIEGYVGPASLRPSSAIMPAPGEAPWARSAEAPLEVQVRWARGDAHVELLEIPGVWIPAGLAWAERGDVALPSP